VGRLRWRCTIAHRSGLASGSCGGALAGRPGGPEGEAVAASAPSEGPPLLEAVSLATCVVWPEKSRSLGGASREGTRPEALGTHVPEEFRIEGGHPSQQGNALGYPGSDARGDLPDSSSKMEENSPSTRSDVDGFVFPTCNNSNAGLPNVLGRSSPEEKAPAMGAMGALARVAIVQEKGPASPMHGSQLWPMSQAEVRQEAEEYVVLSPIALETRRLRPT
jgi:hypothetical protein